MLRLNFRVFMGLLGLLRLTILLRLLIIERVADL
jgi:hypothetical protein